MSFDHDMAMKVKDEVITDLENQVKELEAKLEDVGNRLNQAIREIAQEKDKMAIAREALEEISSADTSCFHEDLAEQALEKIGGV